MTDCNRHNSRPEQCSACHDIDRGARKQVGYSFAETHRLTLFTDDEYRAAFHRAGLYVEVLASPMPGRDRYVATTAPPPP